MKNSMRGRLSATLGAAALVAASILAPSTAYAADDVTLLVACQPGDPGVAAIANLTVSGPTEVGFVIDGAPQGAVATVDVGTSMPITPFPRTSVPDGTHTVQFWVGTSSNIVGASLPVTFPQLCGGENSGGTPSGSISSFGATASGNEDPRSIALQGEALLEDIDGESVTVSFTITGPTTLSAPNATVNPDGSFSSSVTGQTIPDGTYSVTAQILIDGTPSGSPSTTSVTFTSPPVDPDPVAATVSGTFTGALVNNTSTVNYTFTVAPNDDEGPFTVIIEDGHGTVVDTVTVTDGTPQTGSFIYECGAEHFVFYLEGGAPTDDAYQLITIPCHVPDGGGNPGGGDNSGGGGDGDGDGDGSGNGNPPGGSTGGTGGTGGAGGSSAGGGNTPGGTTTQDTNANGDVEAPPGAETGDIMPTAGTPANFGLILAGVSLLLGLAVARMAGRVSNVAALVLRAKGLLAR